MVDHESNIGLEPKQKTKNAERDLIQGMQGEPNLVDPQTESCGIAQVIFHKDEQEMLLTNCSTYHLDVV